MKKFFVLIGLLLMTAGLLGGCGKQEAGQQEYWDVSAESEALFPDLGSGYYSLGLQFWKGEPVQLLSQQERDESGTAYLKILLRRGDGSMEVLLEKADEKYRCSCYLGEDGSFYLFWDGHGVTKLDREGREVYSSGDGESVVNIAGTAGDGLLLLLKDNGIYKLAKMNTEQGTITKLNEILIGKDKVTLGCSDGDALILGQEGIARIDLQSGEKTTELSFLGTSYKMDNTLRSVKAFRVGEDKSAEILWSDGSLDRISEESIADRIVLTIRYWNSGGDDWLRNQIVAFNQANETYYVTLDERGENNSVTDFRTQTGIQLATGSGADIIGGSSVSLPYELIEKGAFENLKPYMEAGGIKEEDYFSTAFQDWRREQEVYGINVGVSIVGQYAIDEAWLTDGKLPDMEELLEKMLAAEEKMYFFQGHTSRRVLEYFLQGSEDFFGILDWEEGTCDFGGELFDKMLRVAERYGYSRDNNTAPFLTLWKCIGFWEYEQKEQLRKEGRVGLGYCFDDGWHPWASGSDILAVNAASENKEGAWEFISYLLSEEVQFQMTWLDKCYPVNRRAFARLAEREMAEGSAKKVDRGKVYLGGENAKELTEEILEEFMERIEEAESFPIRNKELLNIVLEEADGYFDRTKSKEEVIQVINNRVGLYMKEHK